MKTILVFAGAALIGTAACRERPSSMDNDDRVTAGKPIADDDDFIQTRTAYQTTTEERLHRIESRIDRLESRTDPAGHSAAVQLRARVDELGDRVEQIQNQTESGWDRFEADTTRSLDQLEQDLDRMVD